MILVLGATGFLGKRVCKKLTTLGLPFTRTSLSMGCDLRDHFQCQALFAKVKPEYVLNCASYVGGIQFGRKHPSEMFQYNLLISINILNACRDFSVKRLVNPISNCAYPAKATLFQEKGFWDGAMHESVMVYGFVRKAMWLGSWAYRQQSGLDSINLVMSNMYGPEDHFEEERSHALGAIILKVGRALKLGQEEIVVWGTGKPVREWLYVDDGAEAMIRAIHCPAYADILNIGMSSGISITDLTSLVAAKMGFKGKIVNDLTKEDGAPYKTVDGSAGAKWLDWAPSTTLDNGLDMTIEWFNANRPDGQP